MNQQLLRADEAWHEQDELLDVIDHLVAEFADRPAGTIIRDVVTAREALLSTGSRDGLAHSVEKMVRYGMTGTSVAVAEGAEGPSCRRTLPRSTPLVLLNLHRYKRRVGQFFVADRVTVRGAWMPLVRLRVRRLRAADGGTES